MIYVLYHAPCLDGFSAAYAAWKKFGDHATYVPCRYQEPVPVDIESGSHVYILDFSYPRDVLVELEKRCQIVVIDHHESAQQDLEGLLFAHFDMTRAGCVLAWEYFHPDVPIPQLLRYVQDRDLWEFKLDITEEVNAALWHTSRDFKKWDECATPEGLQKLALRGHPIIENRNSNIRHQMHGSFVTMICGVPAACVNAVLHPSEMARFLREKHPESEIEVIFYLKSNGRWRWSLRSLKGGVNVAELASKIGDGGGHANAAGTETDWYPRADRPT